LLCTLINLTKLTDVIQARLGYENQHVYGGCFDNKRDGQM